MANQAGMTDDQLQFIYIYVYTGHCQPDLDEALARCAPCNGRFVFTELLRRNFLEADANQRCTNKHCISAMWESSKYCRKHFLIWTPGFSGEEERKEIKSMFEKAISVQWHPETAAMAEVIRRIESQPKIPASRWSKSTWNVLSFPGRYYKSG